MRSSIIARCDHRVEEEQGEGNRRALIQTNPRLAGGNHADEQSRRRMLMNSTGGGPYCQSRKGRKNCMDKGGAGIK